jgi:hypothetical protein
MAPSWYPSTTTRCIGSTTTGSPLTAQKKAHTYFLHDPFSGTTVPLPELNAVTGNVSELFKVRKVLMRSGPHDVVVVLKNNWNHPLILVKPGKGVWPEPQKTPFIYIMDATQFFYIVVDVPVLSKGVQCSKICASQFYIFILYQGQFRTSMVSKAYTVHLDAASCISLLYLSSSPTSPLSFSAPPPPPPDAELLHLRNPPRCTPVWRRAATRRALLVLPPMVRVPTTQRRPGSGWTSSPTTGRTTRSPFMDTIVYLVADLAMEG